MSIRINGHFAFRVEVRLLLSSANDDDEEVPSSDAVLRLPRVNSSRGILLFLSALLPRVGKVRES